MSVATLGIAVDSSQAVSATKALDGLTAAARPAQNAANLLKTSFASVQTALSKLIEIQQASLAQQSTMTSAFDRLSQSLTKVNQVAPAVTTTTAELNREAKSTAVSVTATGRALDSLTTAAKPAQNAVKDLGKQMGDLSTLEKALNRAVADINVNMVAHRNGTAAASRGTEELTNHTGLARHEMINLSRQLQDVGVSLAGGQSPFTVLAQQGSQIADIFGSSKTGTVGGAMRQIVGGIASVITPMRLLGVGVAAAGAAAYVAYGSWKAYTLQLDDAARAAGTTTASMSKLQAAASFKGISADDFNKGMQSFASSVYDAQHNMGDLATVFRANNQHAKTFDEAMEKAADLIQRAGSDQQRLQLLQQMGLPATMEWVRLLSNGAEGLKKAKDAAAEFAANDDLIKKAREFDESWNKAWTNFGLNARSAFQTALDVGSTFFDRMEKLANQAGNASFWNKFIPENHQEIAAGMGVTPLTSFEQRFSGDSLGVVPRSGALADALNKKVAAQTAGPAAVDPKDAINANRMAQQRISMLGELASVADQVKAKELELNAAWLQGGVGVGKYRDAILNAVRAHAEMDRVSQQAAVGVFNLNDANKAAADTLQMWKDKGLLDPTNAEQMAAATNVLARNTRDLADAAKVAGSNLPGLQQALNNSSDINKQMDQFATSSFSTLTTGLADIFDGTRTASQGFADLGKTVIRSLEEMLIKMYIVVPIFNSLKGMLSGGFSGLAGGLAGLIPSANGNVFAANDNGISRYSSQIVDRPTMFAFANGVGLMGEAGAEAIMPLSRGPDGKLGVAAPGGGYGGGKTTINVIGAPNPSAVNVQETVDGRGNRRVDIQLDDAVSAALSKSGSRTRQAMSNNYGAKAVGVRR